MRALVIEDDPGCGELVKGALYQRWPDCVVQICFTAEEGMRAVREAEWDVIVLDLGLPDEDGLSVLAWIRTVSTSPVLVLTARTSEADLVRGLEIGADNWMTKPFSPAELVARIAAVIRRHATDGLTDNRPRDLQSGQIRIDLQAVLAYVSETRLRLTPTQLKILTVLAAAGGRVVSQGELLRDVWGKDDLVRHYHLIKVQIRDMRLRIKEAGGDPRVVQTIRGFGYKIATDLPGGA